MLHNTWYADILLLFLNAAREDLIFFFQLFFTFFSIFFRFQIPKVTKTSISYTKYAPKYVLKSFGRFFLRLRIEVDIAGHRNTWFPFYLAIFYSYFI